MADEASLPRYKCHKEVAALKIAAMEFTRDGTARIAPEDGRYAVFSTKPGYRSRLPAVLNETGYYVVYDDGYESWSPAKAFEEGYTPL